MVLCWGCCHHRPHYDRGLCHGCHAARYGPGNPAGIHSAGLLLVAGT
jgi:hypothetical protein